MKQTAVEWLEFRYKNNINLMDYDFEQAKEMEKQQQGYSEEEVLKKFMTEYKHLQQFYKTKEEFKQHLLSGEVKISIPDMINFLNK